MTNQASDPAEEEDEPRKNSYFNTITAENPDVIDPANKFVYWTKLPEVPKREVIKMLNFLEREAMGQVSRKTRRLVNTVPNYHFETMQFENDYIRDLNKPINWSKRDSSFTATIVTTFDKFGRTECWLSDFLVAHVNSNYTVGYIMIPSTFFNQDMTLRNLFSDVNSKGTFKHIKCNRLMVDDIEQVSIDCFQQMWTDLIDESIETLIIPGTLTREMYRELRRHKHWDNLKHFRVQNCSENTQPLYDRDIEYDDLSHFETLFFDVGEISAEEGWEYINCYRNRNHTKDSMFEIYSYEGIPCEELVKLLGAGAHNHPIANIEAHHTQIFSHSDENLVLVVVIDKKCLRGMICGRNSIEKDFDLDKFEF